MVRQLDRMTYEEVENYVRHGPGIAILNSGATEQHGWHGALGTDTFAAQVVAERVAELVDAVLLPPLPYGVSMNHLAYPGTITLQPSTLALVLKEICANLARAGFKTILIITGNRGNEDALRVAAVEARQPGGPHVLTMGYQDANKGRLAEVLGDFAREINAVDVAYGSDGHGGALECSLGMLYAPDGYRPDRLSPRDRTLVDARRGLSFVAAQYIEEYAPTGVFGDPHGMSPELGRQLADRTAERIAADLRRFLELFPPPGSA